MASAAGAAVAGGSGRARAPIAHYPFPSRPSREATPTLGVANPPSLTPPPPPPTLQLPAPAPPILVEKAEPTAVALQTSLPPSIARGARARAFGATPSYMQPKRRLDRWPGAFTPGTSVPLAAPPEEPPSALRLALQSSFTSSDALIRDMRATFKSRFDKSEQLLQLSTRYLLVGSCGSRCAGCAKFLPTKVIYAFEHPTHRQVEMHMAYKDMAGVRLQPATAPAAGRGGSAGAGRLLELRFRIDHQLSYFTREYDPANEAHDLRIGFLSEADAGAFRERVLEHVLKSCRRDAS